MKNIKLLLSGNLLSAILLVLLMAAIIIGYIKYQDYERKLSFFESESYSLQERIEDLVSELEDLKSIKEELEEDNRYYQNKIQLKERELAFEDKRLYETEVFYEVIKNSEFEDYIISMKYNTKPSLTKAKVSIRGTNNIIDFLQHLISKYVLYYFKENM